jgi:hypothetical protein
VPVNFRLRADEVGYIISRSGSSVLLVDPELDEALKTVTAPHRFVLGRILGEAITQRNDAYSAVTHVVNVTKVMQGVVVVCEGYMTQCSRVPS